MFKLILFDLGGVLFTNGTAKFLQSLSERSGLPREKVGDVLEGELGLQYREGRITRDEFWREAIAALGLKEDANTLEAEWIGSYEIIEKTREIIQKLKGKYKVFFLSGNVREREEALDAKYHFKELFDGGVFSYEAGVNKPDPRIYKIALERAGVKGEETIFTDDKENFLPPAQAQGMTTIHFQSPEQFEGELKRLSAL